MLHDSTFYQDLDAAHFQRRSPEQQSTYLLPQITKLGFECKFTPTDKETVSV